MGMGEQNLWVGAGSRGLVAAEQGRQGDLTPAHDISVSLLVALPGDRTQQQLWFWGREGRPDLGPALAGLGGISGWLVQPIRWPEVMGAESVGLCLWPQSPSTHPKLQATCSPTIFACPHPTLSSIPIPPYSFPKILTKHFCTIKFNHNYKNVGVGFALLLTYVQSQPNRKGPAPHHPVQAQTRHPNTRWGVTTGLKAGTDEAGVPSTESPGLGAGPPPGENMATAPRDP